MREKVKNIIILSIIFVAGCNNINPPGGECNYESFEKKYEVKNIILENDSISAVKYKAVSSNDSEICEIQLNINDLKELKKGFSISDIKQGEFYILKGDKIIKGSCIPYHIAEITTCE